MTVNELISSIDCEVHNISNGDREVTGGYVGDLLSWVMSSAQSGDFWATIMTNLNVIAVAQLTDVAVVIITETDELDPEVIERAKEQNINLVSSKYNSWEICKKLADKV